MDAKDETSRNGSGADASAFGDVRDVILSRANDAGLESEWTERTNDDGNTARSLTLLIPNGREKRRMNMLRATMNDILNCNFEHWTALSDYSALLDRKDRAIEASVRMPLGPHWIPQVLPGVIQDVLEAPTIEEDETSDDSVGVAGAAANFDPERPWRIPIEGTGPLLGRAVATHLGVANI